MTIPVLETWIKRGFDLVIAVLLLPVLGLAFLCTAPAIVLSMGRPIFFQQMRPGRDEVLFTLLKFRSMRSEIVQHGRQLSDSDRVTLVGRLIRSTSIDELPQILNILRGEMSLIGPRPLLPEYGPYYSSEERLRFSVRPGITGFAQVGGRNLVGWDKRLQMDVAYVKDWSLGLDARIAWRTVTAVLGRKGYQLDQLAVPQRLDVERAGKGTGETPNGSNVS
jgi:undecaprenyl phosphate N,N'-diacetylbacillosamine 1-phosphate transferase